MAPDPTPDPEPAPELSEEKINEAHDAWCRAYEHVWADLSKGAYDKEAFRKPPMSTGSAALNPAR
jgi:hypothetical protein